MLWAFVGLLRSLQCVLHVWQLTVHFISALHAALPKDRSRARSAAADLTSAWEKYLGRFTCGDQGEWFCLGKNGPCLPADRILLLTIDLYTYDQVDQVSVPNCMYWSQFDCRCLLAFLQLQVPVVKDPSSKTPVQTERPWKGLK